jgi:hypothetical protein
MSFETVLSTESFDLAYTLKLVASDGTVLSDYEQPVSSFTLESYVGKEKDLPSWRSLISSGQCATTLLDGQLKKIVSSPSIINATKNYDPPQPYYPQKLTVRGDILFLGVGVVGSPPYDEAINRSASNFYSRLQSVETKFKGLVFSGELRESLQLIRHPARSLRNAVSAYLTDLKKGSRYKRSARLSFVRDTWLEWSFGVQPLISDIDSGIQAFYGSSLVRPIFQMVRGQGEAEDLVSRIPQFEALSFGTLKWIREERLHVKAKHYGVYRSVGNGVDNLHRAGFSPSEFVPTLWELIPYSFLVDYFTNIGKVLESWSYRKNELGWCSQGTATEEIVESTDVGFSMPSDPSVLYDWSGFAGYFRSLVRSVHREPNIGTPTVTLDLKVPGNWTQWVNIAALSKQLDSTRKSLNR